MFYLLVVVYELLLKWKVNVWDSDHFQRDEKEHEWTYLSWAGSTHVRLVPFDTTIKHACVTLVKVQKSPHCKYLFLLSVFSAACVWIHDLLLWTRRVIDSRFMGADPLLTTKEVWIRLFLFRKCFSHMAWSHGSKHVHNIMTSRITWFLNSGECNILKWHFVFWVIEEKIGPLNKKI